MGPSCPLSFAWSVQVSQYWKITPSVPIVVGFEAVKLFGVRTTVTSVNVRRYEELEHKYADS